MHVLMVAPSEVGFLAIVGIFPVDVIWALDRWI